MMLIMNPKERSKFWTKYPNKIIPLKVRGINYPSYENIPIVVVLEEKAKELEDKLFI